jgi:hypothetical protein
VVIGLNEAVFKEYFLGTWVDEVEEIARIGMAKHPGISQDDCAVILEENVAGRDTAMRLANPLQVK